MAVGVVTTVTFFVLFSTIPAEGLPLSNTLDRPGYNCKEGEYLDHGTGNCEACCDICCHADITGTAKMCDEECPGYSSNIRHNSNKKRDSFDTKTAQLPQSEWPKTRDTHKNSSKTNPSAVVSIALGIFFAVNLVGTLLAIVWSRRRPPDRSDRYSRDAVPLQCGQQASALEMESSHRLQVSEDVPLKTPVQECGDGYHEAWETQHNTVPKTIFSSASEESLETVS